MSRSVGGSNPYVVVNRRNKRTESRIVRVLNCFGLKIDDDSSKSPYFSRNVDVKAFKTFYSEVIEKGWYEPQTGKSMFEAELEQKKFLIQNNTGSTVSGRMHGCTFSCCRGIMNRVLYPKHYGKNIVLFYKIGDHYMLSLENTFLHSGSNYPRNFPNGIKGDINESMKSHVYGKAFEAFLTLTPKELEVRDENNKKKEESMSCNNFTNILLHKTLETSNNTPINFLMTADIDLFAERVTNPIDLEIYEAKSTGYNPRYDPNLKNVSLKNRNKWAIQINSVNCKKLITTFHNGKYEPINICENSSSDLNINLDDDIERDNTKLAEKFEKFQKEYEMIPDDGSIRYVRINTLDGENDCETSFSKPDSKYKKYLITKCIQQLQKNMKLVKTTTSIPSILNPNKQKQKKQTEQNRTDQNTRQDKRLSNKDSKEDSIITIAANNKETVSNQHSNKNVTINYERGLA